MDKWRHLFGVCHKSRLGYRCKGSNDYKECFGWPSVYHCRQFDLYY